MPRDGDPSSRQGSSRYAKMDGDEFRRGREETTISIRKDKKQEQLQKRRDMRTTPGAGATPPGGMPGPEHPTVGSQAWQEANPPAQRAGDAAQCAAATAARDGAIDRLRVDLDDA